MIERKTIFSEDRVYRYALWREFGGYLIWEGVNKQKEGYVQFIGLNPSTADETVDDQTIRVCQGFAKRWGYGAMCMTNLFAFRATNPRVMMQHAAPIGKDNDAWLQSIAKEASLIIACWGTEGIHLGRNVAVRCMIAGLHHIGLSKNGHPRHPLRICTDVRPQPL